ncbi:MAG TPA: HAMP domain-containing sensor histidine kinase [Vicinamibacterales bacterium]|jgi:two-component system sensor histidine kinase BaeS
MSERAWYRSLYWRIAIGFVACLAIALVAQAVFFVWIIVRGERNVPARALTVFATVVANDIAGEIEGQREAEIERHLVDRYGSLPRPIWVITKDRRVVSGNWGPPPPGLIRRAGERMARGAAAGLDPIESFRARRAAAFAPVIVRGQTVGMVIVLAGRPPNVVARQFGPLLLLIALGLVVGAGAVASALIFRPASRRLEALADTARRLGAGDVTARAPETGGDEITRVARAFNQMAIDLVQRAEALQTSDRLRRQLLADVSHELMTPLTAIRGYLETLDMPSIALDADARSRYVGIVREETSRLERIIGDLLELARLEAGGGSFSREDVAVGQLFARVLARHEHPAREQGVALETEGDQSILVQGDPLRLEQALQNLAANALRHTPSGGRVRLSVERRDEPDTARGGPESLGEVILSVRDTGSGIQPDHLPHVFDRFYKADASRAESTGTGSGLGLSIVKTIVERHGGRITVRSEPNVETVFEIVLPDADPRSFSAG